MIRKSILFIFLAGMASIIFFSGAFSMKTGGEFDDVLVNPIFEQKPSVVDKVQIEFLSEVPDGQENARYMFTITDPLVNGSYHAFNLNGSKVVIRDDGNGADEVAGDRVFSIYRHENLNAFKQEFHQRKTLLTAGERTLFTNARSVRSIDDQFAAELERLNFLDLDPGEVLTVPEELFGFQGSGSSVNIDPERSLMIINEDVLEDPTRTFDPCMPVSNPNGVWTFWELMRQMASPGPGNIASDAATSTFILEWLSTWQSSFQVNSDNVPARPNIANVIQDWMMGSGELDPQRTPMKLTGIVNRLDLRGNSAYGVSDAGEVRFVFTMVNPGDCFPLPFTVILEYGININACPELHDYAEAWGDLSTMSLGSPSYNNALEVLTQQVTLSGANPSKPNQNCINQVRTNENFLAGDWELREFHLNNTGGSLTPAPVVQNPAITFNQMEVNGTQIAAHVAELANYVNSNQGAILNNNYSIPLSHPTASIPFLGGKSVTGGNALHFWDAENIGGGSNFIIHDDARHIISLNTCGGCHGGESRDASVVPFLHMRLEPSGSPNLVSLSRFLTGGSVVDPASRPASSPTVRQFNDLLHRKNDLESFIDLGCGRIGHALTASPMVMTH